MLFSELNRINFNILIQDSNYECVPDISSCHIQNAENWTIWCENEASIGAQYDGWEISSLCPIENPLPGLLELDETILDKPLETTYLNCALNDISSNLQLAKESDLIKIYAGKFSIDGTFDYTSLLDNDGMFTSHCIPIKHHQRQPIINDWWTFNNGAFQWIGGPKSIQECRFSYGPFTSFDPHHCCDDNHKFLDDCISCTIIPNIVFVFDKMNSLRGIVSLPCQNETILNKTKNFLNMLIDYATSTSSLFDSLTFDNFGTVLKSFTNDYAYFPLIRISNHLPSIKSFVPPVSAVFFNHDETNQTENTFIPYFYVCDDDLQNFLNKSTWKNYSINKSISFNQSDRIVSRLFESSLPCEYNDADAVENIVLMTLSDLFKQAKQIRKSKNTTIVVLPTGFCNKEILNIVSDVKYLPLNQTNCR